MRIKEDYILTEIAGSAIVVAAGETSQTFNGMIRLNAVAACIWRCLAAEKDLEETVDAVAVAFDVEREQAMADTRDFIAQLKKAEILE